MNTKLSVRQHAENVIQFSKYVLGTTYSVLECFDFISDKKGIQPVKSTALTIAKSSLSGDQLNL